jgi:small subunit ribosomal protein S3
MEQIWLATEEYKEGRTPLHTFRADIDYSLKEAHDGLW